MYPGAHRSRWLASLLASAAVLVPTALCQAADEDQVRQAFQNFQAAVKARDTEKLWGLLDKQSRTAANAAAKEVQTAYQKANDANKQKLEKALGLSAAELAGLTGKVFLKSNKYFGKYHEVPTSTIEKVVVEGDKATVFYREEDGDKEKLPFVREDGKWKASAAP
jgi:hypothetical protein